MKKLFLILNTILLTFFITGCQIDSIFKPSQEEMQLKEKELDAKIEQNKKKLDLQKEIELAKIDSSLEKEKLLTQNREKDNLYKLQLKQNESQLQLQKYLVLLAGLVIIVIAIAVYIYLNNRRKDKLKAYEDNMEKYFKQKENQAKVQIANKIIETVASGNLSESQENLLVSNLDGNSNVSAKTLKSIHHESIVEAEIIEEQKEEKSSKKKKKDSPEKKEKKKSDKKKKKSQKKAKKE